MCFISAAGLSVMALLLYNLQPHNQLFLQTLTIILLQARRYSADEIDYDEYADTVNQINNSKNCSSNHFPTGWKHTRNLI